MSAAAAPSTNAEPGGARWMDARIDLPVPARNSRGARGALQRHAGMLPPSREALRKPPALHYRRAGGGRTTRKALFHPAAYRLSGSRPAPAGQGGRRGLGRPSKTREFAKIRSPAPRLAGQDRAEKWLNMEIRECLAMDIYFQHWPQMDRCRNLWMRSI